MKMEAEKIYHGMNLNKGHDGQPHLKGEIWKSINTTKASKATQIGLKENKIK